ncbi:MAG: methionine synthase, partial [Burkholderiaceae bacterium]|nr:methionine synthase [Burkholderiaceae bacterium]
GKYPAILRDETVGAEASRVLADAQAMLAKIVEQRWLTAHAVVGFWPAHSVRDDDIELYADETRQHAVLTWHGLRQQTAKEPDAQGHMRPSRCLADFIAPRRPSPSPLPEGGEDRSPPLPLAEEGWGEGCDYIGAFACTAGLGVDAKEAEFLGKHDDYSVILLKALADRLAEACAEWLHQRVRTDWWGYASGEQWSAQDLIGERYQGIRPAPGYPACPGHRVKKPLFALLGAHDIGMHLSEHYAMLPAASVSGFYFSHPQARYFSIGKIGRDQAIDLAERSGAELAEVGRALAAQLDS